MRKLFYLFLILLCCISLPVLAKEEKSAKEAEAPKPAATITVEEMEQQLKSGSTGEDLLYIKLKDEQVDVYQSLAKDRSLRKQLIISLPNTEMLRLYTINKATYEQMSRMLLDYEESNYNFNGYKIITDVDQPRALENGKKLYRFWFMKIKREKASRRGVNFPIGIGIGIGGGHHHGPWIGVGW
ncbi:MAG: hypothetical protein ACI3XH_06310 [Phascolarctobacterium sp.]